MSVLKRIIKILFPFVLGFVIVYFLYRGTDFKQLWIDIREIDWKILSFSLSFGLLGNLIRGLRLGLLFRSLGYQPKKSVLICVVVGSYAVNFVLPRAGELWRCGMLTRKEKIPFSKGVETLLLDRLADLIMVFFISLVAFFYNTTICYQYLNGFHVPSFLLSPCFYGELLAVIVILTGGILCFLALKEKPIIKKNHQLHRYFFSVWQDVLLFWKMKKKKLFVGYSFGIWMSYFLYFYSTFYAFHFTSDLGIKAGLFVFALSSIGMAIPSNGGLGPWQAAVIYGLCMFQIPTAQAKVFATAVFTLQSVWVVFCGLVSILLLSLKKNLPSKR